eukprot:TCONS_00012305-protein
MNGSHYNDVGSIFQQQTVAEIEGIERKIRGEIEKRKQDLRVMVGERYRDLINAADTIQDMKKVTNEVTHNIEMISNLCANFSKDEEETKSKQTKKTLKTSEEAFYSLATQMDLLVDTPEKIWSALDEHKYLDAAQLYLLSHHIVNTSININTGQLKRGSQRDIFASFPILHHQWAAISHFKPSILKGGRNALKDATIPDLALTQSLCSIVLLEDYSPRQVFNEFLAARKNAFQDVFNANFHTTSSKKQISDLTHMLRLTIEQIVSLFYTDESKPEGSQKPLFYTTLQGIVNGKVSRKGKVFEDLFGDDMDVLTVSKFLPSTVSDFMPKLRSIPVTISISYIQKHTTDWLNTCTKEIHQGVKNLLSFINDIKGLALVRDAVYEILKDLPNAEEGSGNEDEEDDEEERGLSWKQCCQISLNRHLSIWDEVFRPLFFQRAKEILERKCGDCFNDTSNMLHDILNDLKDTNNPLSDTSWDHDFTSFLWHEFPTSQDLMVDPTTTSNMSMLGLKVRNYTPSIQRLCNNFNNILKTIIQDAMHFLESDEDSKLDENELRLRAIKKDVQKMISTADEVFTEEASQPFNRFADAHQIRAALNTTFSKGVEKMCKQIGEILVETKNALKDVKVEKVEETVDLLNRATYLARLCLSLPDLCTNIETITNHQDSMATPQRTPLKRQLSSHTRESLQRNAKKISSESLDKINAKFQQQHQTAADVWIDWTCKTVGSLVRDTLRSSDDHFVFSVTHWDTVSIQEEGEGGEKIKSTIRVPSMPSFYLTSLLYRMVEELHRVGGSIFLRSSLRSLSVGIGDAILRSHKEYLNNMTQTKSTFQNKIFQFIFDIKFIVKLLAGSSDLKDQETVQFRQGCTRLINALEQMVDPFDLDVFIPHIDKAVQKQLQRSSLIFGSIGQMDKHSLQGQHRVTSSTDQANVMPLVTNPPRFMLLPISTHKEQRKKEFSSQSTEDSGSQKHPLFVHKTQVTVN